MEEEDIERQMNELDMLLEGTVVRMGPPVERLNPRPLNYGTGGQILTASAGAPVWVDADTATVTWNQPYPTWITPGQTNPTTGEPYTYMNGPEQSQRESHKDSFLDAWLRSGTKEKQPVSKSYNFFTSLTLTKDPNDKVELSKRLRERLARSKSRNNNNRNSETSN